MRDDERIGLFAQAACVWEATARKPGNVHPQASFADLSYLDFVLSAAAIGPALSAAPHRPVGETILAGIRRARQVARTNTNLGILLLLAPLARAAPAPDLRSGTSQVLAELTIADAEWVYEAIRLVNPGGLGEAAEQDVRETPTQTLREVMVLAADRDLIALQYANGFREVFDEGVPALGRGLAATDTLEGAIVWLHLQLLASHPDSLIRRKCGDAEAAEASRRAQRILKEGWPHTPAGWNALAELDAWMRADGHRRNPGTTADLVAACLFAALREGMLTLPCQIPWRMTFPWA